MADRIDDGGVAFPAGSYHGMTLRDYFAAKNMPIFANQITSMTPDDLMSVMRVNHLPGTTTMPGVVAFLSYAYADAMIAARKATA